MVLRNCGANWEEMLPRFPMVPEVYWTSVFDEVITHKFLREILAWRCTTIKWLKGVNSNVSLSEGLVDLLLWVFGDKQTMNLNLRPYRLTVFPNAHSIMTKEVDMMNLFRKEDILVILVWRARIIDFLADVWDTIGSPLFEMEECSHATELFLPEACEGVNYCAFCLQNCPISGHSKESISHYERCPIQQILQVGINPNKVKF